MRQQKQKLLVFSDDWGRHPSSCQHLIGQLTQDIEVCWVNTIGTRRPSLNSYTLSRGLEKLGQWGQLNRTPPGDLEPNRTEPLVIKPIMWPSFGSTLARRINRTLVGHAIRRTNFVDPHTVVVTTLPLVADLRTCIDAAHWVYYCVDDLSAWPGLDGGILASMEKQLVREVDRIIVVSNFLKERMEALGRSAEVLSHGLDLDLWREPCLDHSIIDLPRSGPLVVFWGVIDRRLDMRFMSRLSRELTSGTILMVGPQNDPDPALNTFRNVRIERTVPLQSLPSLGARADALIMPYADLPVTRALQPLKFKEYLATGKPVVVTDLPAIRPWSDACDIARSPEEFASTVRTRIETGTPRDQAEARSRLSEETWEAKAKSFSRLVFG